MVWLQTRGVTLRLPMPEALEGGGISVGQRDPQGQKRAIALKMKL